MEELVYQKKRKEKINKVTAQVKRLCKKGLEGNFDESQTRNAIIDVVLEKGLGLKFGENLFSEHSSGQGWADYLIKYKGKPQIIIEAKKIGYRLSEKVFFQTMGYSLANQVK
ncbi:MAG: hypothetical protein Q4F54_05640 [Coriobacteriia bacterium]|nr:hypothetical protein [Coriobacteriia bacterium]